MCSGTILSISGLLGSSTLSSDSLPVSGDDGEHFKPARWSKDDGTLVFEVSSEGYIEKDTSIDIAVVLVNLPRKMIATCQVRVVTLQCWCDVICEK